MSAALDTRARENTTYNPQQGLAPASDGCQVPSGSRPRAPDNPAWCVVATYPQAERRAHAALHRFGFTAYLPLVTVRWADRTWHTKPLFPGYCFVRLDLTRPWHPVTCAPGVFQLLAFDGKPATCSDTVVEAVRSAVHAAKAFAAVSPPWKPGTPCSLALGPLADMPAVVTQVGQNIATVAVMMFGHLRTVSVDANCLRPRDE